ncbi:MAG TPA: hypothetical protein VF529_10570 [Solirubrobacteraceae bacterium]|jgi:hypothetical protein
MHLSKRFLMLALAAVAASFAVAVPSASAAQIADCTFTGLAGGLTPVIAAPPTTGGAGSYNFGGDAALCTYTNTATTPPTVVTTTAHIESKGRYENDICGTGRAFGNTANRPVGTTGPGTYIDFASGSVPDITQVDYRIDFVAGEGALRGGNLVNKDGVTPATTGTVNGDNQWVATGVVNIRPANTGGCVNAPVAAFEVAGHFRAVHP